MELAVHLHRKDGQPMSLWPTSSNGIDETILYIYKVFDTQFCSFLTVFNTVNSSRIDVTAFVFARIFSLQALP